MEARLGTSGFHTVDDTNPALPSGLKDPKLWEFWHNYSLLWVMQDLYHQPGTVCGLGCSLEEGRFRIPFRDPLGIL